MLKAILYYILLIAEFFVTLAIGGFLLGLYLSFCFQKEEISSKTALISESTPVVTAFCILSMLVVWFTFHKAKFSKFTLGKVRREAKWQAMLYASLPIFGFTMAYYAMMSLFHIHFLPKELTDMSFIASLPFILVGSFFSAYVFYGAIQEELIRCGKKKWVQLLTLCIMMLPACVLTVSSEGDVSVEHFGVPGILSTCYAFWVYGKTRSTIVLFVVYIMSNLVPYQLALAPLPISIICAILGLVIMVYGYFQLKRKFSLTINQDED